MFCMFPAGDNSSVYADGARGQDEDTYGSRRLSAEYRTQLAERVREMAAGRRSH